ncbi:hypothetical protein J3P89_21590 [Pseudomonas sp. Z1-14]|uniref:hypothetical protein n=1 Tax=Pseudomonas sp. Z1-14 TaxID=2817409 RepID=UPI003DA8498A
MNNFPEDPADTKPNDSAEEKAYHEHYDRQIQALESAKAPAHSTRFIMKVVNNTEHDLDANKNTLGLSADNLATLQLPSGGISVYGQDFRYVRNPGSRSKDIYHHSIQFGEMDVGVFVEFGLRVETSFGLFAPTVTPVRICKVTTIGTLPINCTARITRALSTDPYSFTMEVTLG